MKRFYRKIAYLDELLRIPVLRVSEMSPDQLAIVTEPLMVAGENKHATKRKSPFPAPITPMNMLRTLSYELARPVVKTDFGEYKMDPIREMEINRAKQLISDALLTWRKRQDKSPQNWCQLAQHVVEFVEREGAALMAEIESGDVSRWSGEDYLYGEWRSKLSPEQLEMTRPAFTQLAESPAIHPEIKREILHHICDLISKVKGK